MDVHYVVVLFIFVLYIDQMHFIILLLFILCFYASCNPYNIMHVITHFSF